MIFYRVVLAALLVSLSFQPPPVKGEGFGPFPVRNFRAFQLLVLSLPGDRATVVNPGMLDVRLELVETTSVNNEDSPQSSAIVKFETLRSGLFLRYGATDRLEHGLEAPVLYRYQGFMDGAINKAERATTGLAPMRAALRNTNFVFNVTRNGQTTIERRSERDGAVGYDTDESVSTPDGRGSDAGCFAPWRSEVPTGDQSDFFGSGSPDFGLGLAVENL
ncbi:MAG TPA: hypothetical protein VF205_02155 [Nitrospiraceae bacterium]